MRSTIRAAVGAALLFTVPFAFAADAPADTIAGLSTAELDFLTDIDPSVHSWRKVVPGLFESSDASGVVTRVYQGDSGKELYLLGVRDRLRLEQEYAVGVRESQRKSGDSVTGSLGEVLEELTSGPVVNSAKATQTGTDYVTACQFSYQLKSTFQANTVLVDHPVSTATSSYGGAFGPPAPGPYSFYRSVYAEVSDGAGNFWTDSAASRSQTATISASNIGTTFGGSCGFKTDHVVQVFCSNYTIEDFYAVTRQQTCSGVLNGSPIQETWN